MHVIGCDKRERYVVNFCQGPVMLGRVNERACEQGIVALLFLHDRDERLNCSCQRGESGELGAVLFAQLRRFFRDALNLNFFGGVGAAGFVDGRCLNRSCHGADSGMFLNRPTLAS